jgi:hypothetical protein
VCRPEDLPHGQQLQKDENAKEAAEAHSLSNIMNDDAYSPLKIIASSELFLHSNVRTKL